jgi:hypothetical protein
MTDCREGGMDDRLPKAARMTDCREGGMDGQFP